MGALIVSPADSGIIWEADYSTLPLGAAGTLPSGLLFARALNAASTSETVQTSDSTVVTTGLTADVPRCGQRTADVSTRGLVLEHEATNLCTSPRNLAAAWATQFGTTTVTTNHLAGPDGSSVADRVQVNASSSGIFYNSVSMGWFAIWVRHTSGSGTYSGGITTNANLEQTVDTTWRRLSQISAADQTTLYIIERAYAGAALTPTSQDTARDVCIDLVQIGGGGTGNQGRFPTECVLTNGSAIERKGERLYHPTIATLLDGGRLSLLSDVIPKGAATGYGEAMRVWHKDASNYAEISHTTRRLNVVIGGSSWNPATALSWAANDNVELWIEAGGGSMNSFAKYRVNGGSVVDLGNSGSPHAAIATGTAINLLGDSNGASTHTKQLTCWARRHAAYKADRRPSWAA